MTLLRVALALALSISTSATAQQTVNWNTAGEEATRLLADYLRIDNSNPPGNEPAAAAFLRGVLEREGIAVEVWTPAPGKANLVARLPGHGGKRPLILLHHMDVVGASPEYWSVDPFGGVVKDGHVWGRGAIDTKGLGIAQLVALLTLKRQGITLDRDVLYVATSDEEIGGVLGAGDLAKNHSAALRNAEYVLNEGGSIVADSSGRTLYYGITAAEKAPFWLELIARGMPGHGSAPRPETAPNRLVRALERVRNWQTPITVTAPVEAYFRAIAPTVRPDLGALLADIRGTARNAAALARVTAVPGYNALLRNTVSITVLQGSNKTNVIPPEARAQLDVRLLPGQTQEGFLAELRRVIADDSVEVKPLGIGWPAPVSSTDNAFFRAIAAVAERLEPGAKIAPLVQAGFTDCHYFLELGMSCYGLAPFRLSDIEMRGLHGNDERLSIENLRYGTRFIYELLREVGQ